MAPQLPVETLEYLVDFTSSTDLFHLSTTSHVLGAMAERRLYRNMTFLTNAEKLIRGPWFESAEKWAVCLRRSVLAQRALIKRPHRLKYVRSISLDGSYHCGGSHYMSRRPRVVVSQGPELEDVIDPICLVRMVNLRDLDCVRLRIGQSFRHIVYAMKEIDSLYFDDCSFYTPGGLETIHFTPPSAHTRLRLIQSLGPGEPVDKNGWESYVDMRVQELDVTINGIATHFFGKLRERGVSNTLITLRITMGIPDEGFAVAFSEFLSSAQVLTSVTIESPITNDIPIILPSTAVSGLKSYSGSLKLAPIFVQGRPVEFVDLKILDQSEHEKINATTFSFLCSSTAKIAELRLHCGLNASHVRQSQWQEAINRVPGIVPELRRLSLGTIPIATKKHKYPEALVEAGLPRLASLVELHFNSKGVYHETVKEGLRSKALEKALRSRSPCKRRDKIIAVCAETCPSLQRIVFGEGRGWGGYERTDNDGWVMFLWDESDDFWKLGAVDVWPRPRPDAHVSGPDQEIPTFN